MEQDITIGPRLSDAEFFDKIDTARPSLQDIPQAVAQGDWATARRLFAAEVRQTLRPERFFQIKRTFRGSHFMYEGETVEQAAERILSGELISCSTPHCFGETVDWFINPTFNQYKEWTWQLSRHSEWGILAQRYRETGDERFAQAFVRFFQSWVRQAVVPENAPGGNTLCWRTIEAGIRIGGAWQWALHSFYRSPCFTDDVLVDWFKSVWEHGWRLRHFHRTGNWLIMEMNGLAQIGILYGQFKDALAWKTYAFDRLTEELDAQVYPDGFQVELSTGYHQVDIRNYQWLMDVCRAYDEPIPPAFDEGMRRMHCVNVLMMMPDGRLPDVNDGGWHDVSTLMEQAAQDYADQPEFRWAATRGREGEPPTVTSHLFTHAGYAIMRSGWQPDALWALFDGGPFGYGHQHEDKLNLILHAYGRLLLTEGGNYAYDSSEMRRYVLSTRAHNTVRIDGHDQNRRLNYARQTFDVSAVADILWKTTPQYDVAEAVYDEGYGPQAVRTVSHRRKVLFIKQGQPGPCWIVIDRLLPTDAATHTYQALWHFDGDRLCGDSTMAYSNDAGQPNLTIIPAPVEGLWLSVISGQGATDSPSPEWQGWKAIKNHQQGEYAPAPTAVYEWMACGPTRLVTLLYPTRPGEHCPVRRVAAASRINDTLIQIERLDGTIISLDESDF